MTNKRPLFNQTGSIKNSFIIGFFLVAIILLGSWCVIKDDRFQLFGKLIYRVETEQKVVALTFDDGPKPGRTQTILEILERENVPATFYLNGESMKRNPTETQLLIDSGHELGNHSYSHPRMVFMSYDEIEREIQSTTSVLREFGYQGTIRFRPPYGKSFIMLPLYLKNNDITTVTWDVDPEWFDGSDTPEAVYQRTMEQVKSGSIILLHVMYGDGSTLKAVPKIISSLKEQGYEFKTVEQLITLNASKKRASALE